MKVLSHRGYHVEAGIHENTHAAFERAIESGVDGIETDIRLSADEQPVLFHDRLAPDGQSVESLTRRQLEDIAGYEIPTLAEILTRWPEVFWNLEVKCPAAVDTTIDAVQRLAQIDNILLTSFRHDVVLRCAQRLDAACGLIVAHTPVNVPQMLDPWKAHPRVRTIVWDFNVSDRGVVCEAKTCGFKVFVYGAVTPAEHERCREWMLDGVITDFPDRARRD
jgi:glycerophosphoryl diester phosphodiesterase